MNTRAQTEKPKSKIVWPMSPAQKKKRLAGALNEINKTVPALQAAGALAALPIEHKDRFTKQIREELKDGRLDAQSPEATQQADDYLGTNAAWDEVNVISHDCAQLLRTASLFSPSLRNEVLMSYVENKGLLIRLVNSITRDTMTLLAELNKIRETHAGREGGAKTAEDLMDSCSAFTDYVNFMDRHQASVIPTSVWISEIIQIAVEKLRAVDPETAAAVYQDLVGRMNEISTAVDGVTGGTSDASTPVVQTESTTA